MKIVLVDDSKTSIALMHHFSSKIENAECLCFSTSEEGLAYLASGVADIIVLDYSMPGMTGIEMAKRVRASANHAKTPILMVTGSSQGAVRQRALEVGVTDFLTKPVDAVQFVSRVKSLVAESGARQRLRLR